jgi:hypothetical protein
LQEKQGWPANKGLFTNQYETPKSLLFVKTLLLNEEKEIAWRMVYGKLTMDTGVAGNESSYSLILVISFQFQTGISLKRNVHLLLVILLELYSLRILFTH